MATDGSGTVDSQTITPRVDVKICSGCGRCVAACPEKGVTLETVRFHKSAVVQRPELCTACNLCINACPVAALHW